MDGSGTVIQVADQTCLVVDGFRSPPATPFASPVPPFCAPHAASSTIFVLSHAHSDHYVGLSERWHDASIYCTHVTARLLQRLVNVDSKWLVAIDYGEEVALPGCPAGTTLTLLPASHCPGAAMILLRLADGTTHLHTGDFRYDAHTMNIALANKAIHNLYLDTTYCHPRYASLPPQDEAISLIGQLVRQQLARDQTRHQRTLFVVATYVVGKERVLSHLAALTGAPVIVNERKYGVLTDVEFDRDLFIRDEDNAAASSSCVRAVDWNTLGTMAPGGWRFLPDFTAIAALVQPPFTHVMAFVPTGWTWSGGGAGDEPKPAENDDSQDVRSRFRVTASKKRKRTTDNGQPVDEGDTDNVDGIEVSAGPLGSSCERSNNMSCFMIPYSEHSSFSELREFVGFLKPVRVIPTVVGKTQKAETLASRFDDLIDRSAGRAFGFKSLFFSAASPVPSARPSSSAMQVSSSSMQVSSSAASATTINCPVCGQAFVDEEQVGGHIDHCLASSLSTTERPSDPQIRILRELVGRADPSDDVLLASLLERSSGNVEQAVNLYFDQTASSQPLSSPKKKQATLNSFFGSVAAAKAATVQVATAVPPTTPVQTQTTPTTEYLQLAKAFDAMMATKSRIQIVSILAGLFRSVAQDHPDDLTATVYLCSNRLAPPFQAAMVLGVGGSIISQAISEATGMSPAAMKSAYQRLGDIGDVAQEARSSMRTLSDIFSSSVSKKAKTLTVADVYNKLCSLAKIKGPGSTLSKRNLLRDLLVACREHEARYLVRTAVGNLRVGAVGVTTVVALAHAFYTGNPEGLPAAVASLKACYSRCPDYGQLVQALLDGGIDECARRFASIRPGTPLVPMLGKITRGLEEIVHRFSGHLIACDCKYDGQRAQVHVFGDGQVKIFSRHLENMTEKYPDLVELLPSVLVDGVTSIVLDAEIVAVEHSEGNNFAILPFQALSTRARKAVQADEVTVRVCVFAFDMMMMNGESLLDVPFGVRRVRLQRSTRRVPGRFDFSQQSCFTATESSLDGIRSCLLKALESRCEGIMVKLLGVPGVDPILSELSFADDRAECTTATTVDRRSFYQPAHRSDSWLKVKKDYVEGIVDTLDLVPIAAWWGNGRKAGWLSPFLMACFDPETERWEGLCKVMTGFTDAFYKEITAFYTSDNRSSAVAKPYYAVDESMRPDVWLEPLAVWEIQGADMSLSPVHLAARGALGGERGISLRFPRFVRLRDDKVPEQATTSDQVAKMYKLQSGNAAIQDIPEEDDNDDAFIL